MEADFSQRAVLGYLLERHPAMLSLDEPQTTLADVQDVEHAARQLAQDGLVTILGDRVGLTRAAVRMDQLDPI